MSDQLVLALDVGGSSVKSAMVANGQHIVGSVCIDEIQSDASAPEILNALAAIISGHRSKASDVDRIAFAFPGPFDYEQGISLLQGQAKYDALYGLPIGMNLKEILGTPSLEMRYRNDAEAAILGEARYGAGMPYAHLLGVTLGTGLGSSFIVNGMVVTKGAGVPVQGWLYLIPYGAQRADDVFSTRGLVARLQEHGIAATDIASAMRTADNYVLAEVFASFGADFGAFLQSFVSDFHADAVLVTGGIAEAWDQFASSLIRSLTVPVLRGTLGNRAALLGAAALYP